MKNSIVKEAKEELAAKKANEKANKKPMVVEVKKLIINTIITITLLSIGAFIGIKANDAVNSYIDNRVQAQVQSLTSK